MNTRLYDNTGGTKYYPNRHVWADAVLEKYSECAKRFLSVDHARKIISKEAVNSINVICDRHIYSDASGRDKEMWVKETYSVLSKYILTDPDEIDSTAYNKYMERKEGMTNGSINSTKYETSLVNNSIMHEIKSLIKRIIIQIKYVWVFRIHIKSMI